MCLDICCGCEECGARPVRFRRRGDVGRGLRERVLRLRQADVIERLGRRDGDLVEVQGEGLTEGMTVGTEGAYGLPEESQIRVIGR